MTLRQVGVVIPARALQAFRHTFAPNYLRNGGVGVSLAGARTLVAGHNPEKVLRFPLRVAVPLPLPIQ
jgi:hypothetical protein